MATQSRGAPYPLGTDPNNTAADIQALSLWANDRPGVAALTTTQRNALTGVDRWDGKLVLDTTLDKLFRWDAGLATWVQISDSSEIQALLATAGTPADVAATASRGVSTSAARADHSHAEAASSGTIPLDANVNAGSSPRHWYQRGRQVTIHAALTANIGWNNTWGLAFIPAAQRPIWDMYFAGIYANTGAIVGIWLRISDGGLVPAAPFTLPSGGTLYIHTSYAVA